MSWRGGRRRVGAPRAGNGDSWRHPSWRRWALLAAALAIVGAALWVALPGRPSRPTRTPVRVEREQSERGSGKAAAGHRRSRELRRAKANGREGVAAPAGQLALVIDDLGRSVDEIAALDALAVPLSYSVLPYETETAKVV